MRIRKSPYTPEEDEVIVDNWPTVGCMGVKELLPHRGEECLRRRAAILGVRMTANPQTGGRPEDPDLETIRQRSAEIRATWTDEQERIALGRVGIFHPKEYRVSRRR